MRTLLRAAVSTVAMSSLFLAFSVTGAPNLIPFQPAGWSDKIVVSTSFGTTTDSTPLTTFDPIYIDWAVGNIGDATAFGGFYTSLYVDNLFVNSWFYSSPLNPGNHVFVTDYFLGSLNAGSHTVTIVADSGFSIAEGNEADNGYNKIINVVPPSQPNLSPFQPSGWSDKIVVSTTTNTTADSAMLTTEDSLYLDWAIINDGTAATASPFLAALYVDGFFVTTWNNNPPVNTNTWQLIEDYPLGSFSAGTHTLTIVADSSLAIAESDEFDNSYTKVIDVVALPEIRIAPTNLAFNASVTNPPIFVEIDWMEDAFHSHRPSQEVLDGIVETFAAEGFTIHLELSDPIPHQNVLNITNNPSSSVDVRAIRDQYFDHINDNRYFYSIWGHDYSFEGGSIGSSGIADLPGRIHLVTLGNFDNLVGTTNQQVGTFIHEFGHNLGQKHGGVDGDNYKPNYLSVMNYLYQFDGVGSQLVALGLANTSAGLNNFGYSHGTLAILNENNLNENLGLGLGRAVDWNCDGDALDSNVIKDLQGESWCSVFGPTSSISDFDNWSDIVGHIRTSAFAAGLADSANSTRVEPCMTWQEYQELKRQQQSLIQAASTSSRGDDPPNAGDDPPSGDRGGSLVGRQNASTTFTIFNDGAGPLTVSSIELDAAAPWISWWPAAPLEVQPGQARKVVVYVNYDLAPAVQTTRRILVRSDDSDESPYPNGVFVQTTGGTAFRLGGISYSNGVVSFSVAGPVGAECVVQVSTNLFDWSSLTTNTIPAGGTVPITDTIAPGQPQHFYRAVLP